MIFDEMRKLKQSMNQLQLEIDNFTILSAVRYDQESVQSSPRGDNIELMILRKQEQESKFDDMKNLFHKKIAEIDLNIYTKRQREFINLYYFNAFDFKKCSEIMNVEISALSRIKRRVCRTNSQKKLDVK